jgi:sulfite reductase alpha subunit-like flavoprotein
MSNPYFAKLIKNQKITSSECEQDVRHLELDLGKSGITYLPGDVVYIHPRNPRDIAEDFIRFLGYDPDDFIVELREQTEEEDEEEEIYEGKGGKGRISTSSRFSSLSLPLSLRDLATYYLDFLGSPKRYFFELLSKFATAEHEVEKLNFFASSEGQEEVRFYCTKEHRSFLEVFQDFPSAKPPLNYLLEMIPPLLPRPFSVSSSLKLHPNHLHVTMLVVKYSTPLKRRRKGLCSNWLASLDPSSSSSEKDGRFEEIPRIPIWVKPGSLRLPPNPETPVIMVGPGTGLAIFRSFIQERHWQRQQGNVTSLNLLPPCSQREGT